MRLFGELPVIQAPMAGGPSTPELTAAVTEAGGYGFVAGGYLSPDAFGAVLDATRALTGGRFGVNLFVPTPSTDPSPVAVYAARLRPEAERLGVQLGEPRWSDDDYAAKLDVALAHRVDAVSFTFGCPSPDDVDRVHSVDARAVATVTSAGEAIWAYEAGVDALIVQGTEAGGHQGIFLGSGPNTTPLAQLLDDVADAVALPLVAAGGLTTAHGIAATLSTRVVAAQLGTAFLATPEAGTSTPYRAALLERRYPDTLITRAFSGRYARGLANRFAREHTDDAPDAYPEVHYLTRPLRAAATSAGDPDVPSLWAGTGWRDIVAEPAADIVRRLAAGARSTTQ